MNKKYIVAVDLGGTNVKVALIKGTKIISRRQIPTKSYKTKDALLKGIVGLVKEIASSLQTYEVCNCKPRRFAASRNDVIVCPCLCGGGGEAAGDCGWG